MTTALPPRVAIGRADPLRGHHAHGIRGKCGWTGGAERNASTQRRRRPGRWRS